MIKTYCDTGPEVLQKSSQIDSPLTTNIGAEDMLPRTPTVL